MIIRPTYSNSFNLSSPLRPLCPASRHIMCARARFREIEYYESPLTILLRCNKYLFLHISKKTNMHMHMYGVCMCVRCEFWANKYQPTLTHMATLH